VLAEAAVEPLVAEVSVVEVCVVVRMLVERGVVGGG